MRRLFLTTIIAMSISCAAFAQQKVAYIYSEKVFKAMPEYTTAVDLLENYAESAQTTAESKLQLVQVKYLEYKQKESNMTDSQREAMKNEIIKMEREANNYEDSFFEEGGEMSKKKDELMKPLEQKVIAAVDKLAAELGYDMIFDLSVAQIAIFKSPELDMTEKVIEIIKE